MEVVERLVTLCGETSLAGQICALIRFAGCPLRCRWCDTVYAQRPEAASAVASVDELVQWVAAQRVSLALLTGGEPLLQAELPRLAHELARTVRVLVETSGAEDISPLQPPVLRSLDIKCPSSGEHQRMRWDNLEQLRTGDTLKLVLANREDYDYALALIERIQVANGVNILLSPAYPMLSAQELADWLVRDRPAAGLNVQLHRLLWADTERR